MRVRIVGEGREQWWGEITTSKVFRRRLRRLVRAPLHRLKVIATPQWREMCREEILALGYHLEDPQETSARQRTPSSLSLFGKLRDAYRLCLWLRTASRVVVEIGHFAVRTPQRFREYVKAIPWEVWMNPLMPLRLYCNVERSKLRHEGVVEMLTLEGILDRFKHYGAQVEVEREKVSDGERDDTTEAFYQRLWVTLTEDRATVDLDLTGAHLHRRGYRLEPEAAPLRETLAAVVVKASGWDPSRPFLDAMTGSGTVAIEAAMVARRMAPGLHRSFLFEMLPSFQETSWMYEKRSAERAITSPGDLTVVAVERDPRRIEAAKRNAARAHLRESIRWLEEDFFTVFPAERGLREPGVVCINPPYGKRLSVPVYSFYRRIRHHLVRCYGGWTAVVLVPDRSIGEIFGGFNPRLFHLPHGGMWISLLLFPITDRRESCLAPSPV